MKLSDEQYADLKKMVVDGVAPGDIAAFFNIAISTVHHYKQNLKNKGVVFPSVRGKRPKGIRSINSLTTQRPIEEVKADISDGDFVFKINGAVIIVNALAKEIKINQRNIEIKF